MRFGCIESTIIYRMISGREACQCVIFQIQNNIWTFINYFIKFHKTCNIYFIKEMLKQKRYNECRGSNIHLHRLLCMALVSVCLPREGSGTDDKTTLVNFIISCFIRYSCLNWRGQIHLCIKHRFWIYSSSYLCKKLNSNESKYLYLLRKCKTYL